MLALIKKTLEEMGEKYYSHEAMMLIYNTGLVESRYKYLIQKLYSPLIRANSAFSTTCLYESILKH